MLPLYELRVMPRLLPSAANDKFYHDLGLIQIPLHADTSLSPSCRHHGKRALNMKLSLVES
jgi:hypothetical protein